MYGKAYRKEASYENIRITRNAHDSSFCCVNPKFLAVVTESGGGGSFVVLPLEKVIFKLLLEKEIFKALLEKVIFKLLLDKVIFKALLEKVIFKALLEKVLFKALREGNI